MKSYKYEYQETDKLCKLLITFSFDKFNGKNQDKVFNDVIRVVSKFELISTLSSNDIMSINKFLKLARHSTGLDTKYFIKKEV
jgi:hypothetical protein